MKNHSFGENKTSWLDNLIAYLRYRRLSAYLSGANSLTDIGCGYNVPFLKWAENKFKITNLAGIDLSINEELSSNNHYDLKIGDLNLTLPWADSSQELITSLAVLEHLVDPEHNLKEIYRLLKTGGRLILTTPAPRAKWLLEFLAFKLGLIDSTEIRDHKKYFSQGDLKNILRETGFSSDKIVARSFMGGFNNLVICTK